MHSEYVMTEATKRLGSERAPLLHCLVECGAVNLQWYLEQKILAANDETVRDHERVLKYAYNFCKKDGRVTFLKESSRPGEKTPDLEVRVNGFEFCVEVKKFRLRAASSGEPVSKIVEAVRAKRNQLPDSRIGFVAIDNFDLGLESAEDGLTHDHLFGALREIQRLAAENPAGWGKPGGLILSAMSTGGVVNAVDPRSLGIPDFVWINGSAEPSTPQGLAEWLASALPGGEIVNSGHLHQKAGL